MAEIRRVWVDIRTHNLLPDDDQNGLRSKLRMAISRHLHISISEVVFGPTFHHIGQDKITVLVYGEKGDRHKGLVELVRDIAGSIKLLGEVGEVRVVVACTEPDSD